MLRKIVNSAKGYDVEISLSISNMNKIHFDRNGLKNNSYGEGTILGICVSKNKKIGYATTSNIKKWKECLESAKKIARISKPLQTFYGIPKKQKYPKISSPRDIREITEGELLKKVKVMVNSALKLNKNLRLSEAGISKIVSSSEFMNSNGIYSKEEFSELDAYTIVRHKRILSWEESCSRRDDINYKKIGESAAKTCMALTKKKSIKTQKIDVVLDYWTLSPLMGIIASALNADNIQKQSSYYSGHLGEGIMDESITIIDDGTLKNGLLTSKSDAEGVSRKRTVLVDKGILKGYMYDFLTAKKDKKESTGNCSSYATKPSISPSNFIIKPGKLSEKQLLSKKCLLVKEVIGSHLINPVSGDFSLNIQNSFLVNNNKLYGTEGMIVGNVFEIMKNIELGKNVRQDSFLVAPLIKLKNVQFVR